jgi:hypothetical protein
MGALRDRVGRALSARVRREVDAALAERLPAVQAAAAQAAYERGREAALREPLVFGPPERLRIAHTAVVNDALLNTVSGSITVEADAFFGHRVALLTGTHDVTRRGLDRQRAVPDAGRDIHIGSGAWIGTGAIILGPCRIGAHAVVSAGSVVTSDVPAETVVAGVPARIVRGL